MASELLQAAQLRSQAVQRSPASINLAGGQADRQVPSPGSCSSKYLCVDDVSQLVHVEEEVPLQLKHVSWHGKQR